MGIVVAELLQAKCDMTEVTTDRNDWPVAVGGIDNYGSD